MKMNEFIQDGDTVVVKRQNYMKFHKLTLKHMDIRLGKDTVDLKNILGEPYWTTFKMQQKAKSKSSFDLVKCDSAVTLSDEIMKTTVSGTDNRDITDDGSSQKLSTEEIVNLRESGLSAQSIVGTLIENSKTFASKTEYSQEKYLKKKEKKYFEYVSIRKPTLRIVSEILIGKGLNKTIGLRMDSLAQLTTIACVRSGGFYIAYETGCQGLVCAALLTSIGSSETIIHVHGKGAPDRQAVYALNFPQDRLDQLLHVSIETLTKGCQISRNPTEIAPVGDGDSGKRKLANVETLTEGCQISRNPTEIAPVGDGDSGKRKLASMETLTEGCQISRNPTEPEIAPDGDGDAGKRKLAKVEENVNKRAKWEEVEDKAVAELNKRSADGLIVVCKEHPANILRQLLRFLKPSRPFVVFFNVREPLQELFYELKIRSDITALRLTETWLRTYQVLPDRTHPDINMSGSGGYLLSGIKVSS